MSHDLLLIDPTRPPKAPRPPAPRDPKEAQRWQHTEDRLCLLSGMWDHLLARRVERHVGTRRLRGWGVLDMSVNPFRAICRELSVLYTAPPDVRHDEPSDALRVLVDQVLPESGLWAMMPRYQQWVLGCREYALRIHATPDGRLRYRPVAPSRIIATASEETPDLPTSIREIRLRQRGKGTVWAWDVLDIRDPDRPVYRVELDDGTDVSAEYLGAGMSGDAYPYRYADGTPHLPYVVHHAERLGDRLWDPYEWKETVEGTLNIGVGWSFFYHVLKDASWPQRYMANGRFQGTGTDGDGTEVAVADPSIVESIAPLDPDNPTIQVGQWQPGGDPLAIQESLVQMGALVQANAGMSEGDAQRKTGDARSGYAISATNQQKREAQRHYAQPFGYADRELMGKSAAMLNRAVGVGLPESGYAVTYREIPLSPDERTARRDDIRELMGLGLMSRVEAYTILHPGTTEQQARAELAAIDNERNNDMPTTNTGGDDA